MSKMKTNDEWDRRKLIPYIKTCRAEITKYAKAKHYNEDHLMQFQNLQTMGVDSILPWIDRTVAALNEEGTSARYALFKVIGAKSKKVGAIASYCKLPLLIEMTVRKVCSNGKSVEQTMNERLEIIMKERNVGMEKAHELLSKHLNQ